MEANWAAENLQVIRTLMERSAIYRRALGPVMILTGLVGIVAGASGWLLNIATVPAFATYWICVSLVAVTFAFLLIRRQALRDTEPFWSPPTRRVCQAMLPCLFLGGVATAPFIFNKAMESNWWPLLPVWIGFYGCAVFSAGFFMPRGMKFFGWSFILAAGALYLLGFYPSQPVQQLRSGHWIMGFFFGALHLAYGVYLSMSEKGKNAA